MAWIGKNGKDGKDGKDDCGAAALVGAHFARQAEEAQAALPVERRIFSVSLRGLTEPSSDVRSSSDQYWQQVQNFGLVDSVTTQPNGDTTLVLLAVSEDEVKSIIENDPVVANRLVETIDIQQLGVAQR